MKTRLNERLVPYGIELSQFSIVGEMELPPQVKTAIEAKLTATQKAIQVENELRETEAAAKKRVAEALGEANSAIEKAKGQSEANRRTARSRATARMRATNFERQTERGTDNTGTCPGEGVPLINIRPHE